MKTEFHVDLSTLLNNRMFYNVPLNCNEEVLRYEVSCITPYGTYFTYVVKDDTAAMAVFTPLMAYLNQPINFADRRVVSHDFGSSASWQVPGSGIYTYQPPANQKFILLSMRASFPRNIAFTAINPIKFCLYKNIPAYGG